MKILGVGPILFFILSTNPVFARDCEKSVKRSMRGTIVDRLYARDVDQLREDFKQGRESYLEEGLLALKQWLKARNRVYELSAQILTNKGDIEDLSEARDLSIKLRAQIREGSKPFKDQPHLQAEFENAEVAYQIAFNQLLGSYGRYVLKMANRVGSHPDKFVEQTQIANMHFLNAALLFDASRALEDEANLFQIFLAYLKRHILLGVRRDGMRDGNEPPSIDLQMAEETFADPEVSTELERHEAVEAFRRRRPARLHQPSYCEIWKLHEVDGLSLEAISKIFGVSRSTVRNWLKDIDRVLGELRQ